MESTAASGAFSMRLNERCVYMIE